VLYILRVPNSTKGKRTMKEKKYTVVLLAIVMSFTCSVRAFDLPLENPGFELPGDGKIKGWDLEDAAYYTNADGDNLGPAEVPGWESDGIIEDSGVESAWLSPTGELWRGFLYNQDGSVYNFCDFTITPHREYTLYFEATGLIKASLIYGTASSRHEIVSETFSPDDWDSFSLSFFSDDYPAAIGGTIGVEFQNVTDNTEETWTGIDNIRIDTTDFVTLISPEDGSFGQPIDSVLEWTVANGWACNVYLGTDPNVRDNDEVVTSEEIGTYDPEGLPYATTFYWTVDAIDPNDGYPFPQPGPTWTFRTISDIPEIIEQPQSVAVFLGETAQISITVLSAFEPHSYQWYRDDVKLSDDAKHTGTQSDILTIHDIEVTDEQASYYCEVSNSEGTVTSDVALIAIKRLLAHYKFENNLKDELNENDGSAESGKIYYVGGIDGMAAKGDKNSYIELSEDAYPKAGVGNGLSEGTISSWIKISYIGGERRFFGAANSSSGTSIMLRSPVDENDFLGLLSFSIRDDSGIEAYLVTPEPVFDNKWHHIVAAYDTAAGDFKLYDNGVVVAETTEMGMGDFSAWKYPVTILTHNDAGTIDKNMNYTAPLDDLRIYNYAMTKTEIADIYYETTGLEICAVDYPAAYDLSGPTGESDCVLDMYDMVQLCGSWLECGLYPNCPSE
jgi:hypothetical protein